MDIDELSWEWIGKFWRDNNRSPTLYELKEFKDSQKTSTKNKEVKNG